jgi:predicted GIY-YIG superfamily endonuclease
MAARAALDAELEAPGDLRPPHHVYVVEVLATSKPEAFYVGQTNKDPQTRIEQHRSGGNKAAQVFRGRATVGATRPDLIPEAWALPTRSAALAAEAFTHLLIGARNPGATVHGDVTLLGLPTR